MLRVLCGLFLRTLLGDPVQLLRQAAGFRLAFALEGAETLLGETLLGRLFASLGLGCQACLFGLALLICETLLFRGAFFVSQALFLGQSLFFGYALFLSEPLLLGDAVFFRNTVLLCLLLLLRQPLFISDAFFLGDALFLGFLGLFAGARLYGETLLFGPACGLFRGAAAVLGFGLLDGLTRGFAALFRLDAGALQHIGFLGRAALGLLFASLRLALDSEALNVFGRGIGFAVGVRQAGSGFLFCRGLSAARKFLGKGVGRVIAGSRGIQRKTQNSSESSGI